MEDMCCAVALHQMDQLRKEMSETQNCTVERVTRTCAGTPCIERKRSNAALAAWPWLLRSMGRSSLAG